MNLNEYTDEDQEDQDSMIKMGLELEYEQALENDQDSENTTDSETEDTPKLSKDAEGKEGVIYFYQQHLKYGFVRSADISADIYFSKGELRMKEVEAVSGAEVIFNLSTNTKGLVAKNIHLTKAAPNSRTIEEVLRDASSIADANLFESVMSHVNGYSSEKNVASAHQSILAELAHPQAQMLDFLIQDQRRPEVILFLQQIYQKIDTAFVAMSKVPSRTRTAQNNAANKTTQELAKIFGDSDLFAQFLTLVGGVLSSDTRNTVTFQLFSQVVEGVKKTYFGKINRLDNVEPLSSHFVPPQHVLKDALETQTWEYVCGWVLYRLSHVNKDQAEKTFLQSLILKVEETYPEGKRRRQIILKQEVLGGFCQAVENLVFHLLQSHAQYGPRILHWIRTSCLANNAIQSKWGELVYQHGLLKKEDAGSLLIRWIKFYLKSRQCSWRKHMHFDPKPVPVFRAALKAQNKRSHDEDLATN